jgi:hypothetical protein
VAADRRKKQAQNGSSDRRLHESKKRDSPTDWTWDLSAGDGVAAGCTIVLTSSTGLDHLSQAWGVLNCPDVALEGTEQCAGESENTAHIPHLQQLHPTHTIRLFVVVVVLWLFFFFFFCSNGVKNTGPHAC